MAISVISQPEPFSFSGNQITFSLQSNDYLASAGQKFVGKIIKDTQWNAGESFIFQFGDERVVMTLVNIPDDSGTQMQADSPGIPVDPALAASVAASFFDKNYVLNKHFEIVAIGSEIIFTARNLGTFYNWKPAPRLSIVDNGIDRKEKPGFKFLFEVFLENEAGTAFNNIYSEFQNADLPFTGILTLDIKNILDAAISNDIPDINSPVPGLCSKGKRRYFCRFAEVVSGSVLAINESPIYHVATGGFSYVGFKTRTILWMLRPDATDNKKDLFLKQGPRLIRTRTNQPEFLYFLNLRDTAELRCKVTVKFADTSADEIIFTDPINVQQYGKAYFPVSYELLQLSTFNKQIKEYVCHLVDQDGLQMSEKVTYRMDYEYREKVRYFAYSSSMGAFDTFAAYGKGSEGFDLTQESAIKPIKVNYNLSDGNKTNYDIKLARNFTVNTGVLDKRRYDLLADFYLSTDKFLCKSQKALPITVTNKKGGENKDQVTRYAQEITYTYNFDDDKYTEGDVEEPGEYLEGFFFGNLIGSPPTPIPSIPVPGHILAITPQQISHWDDLYLAYLSGALGGTSNAAWGSIAGDIENQTDLIARFNSKQAKEDQRLSTGNDVVFNRVTASYIEPLKGLRIPTDPLDPAQMVVGKPYLRFRGDIANPGTPSVVVVNLNDIADVDTAGVDNDFIMYYNKVVGKYMFKEANFGISDVYTRGEIQDFFNGAMPITGYSKTSWDAAYGWGNHAAAGYALANGSNASGTWGINISGAAKGWGSSLNEYDGDALGAVNTYLMGFSSTNKWGPKSKSEVQAFVDINNGSTLNNNISGNSAKWGNRTADFDLTPIDTGVAYIPVFHGGTGANVKTGTRAAIRDFLGLTSGAYDLQWVTTNGNTTTNSISIIKSGFVADFGEIGNQIRFYSDAANQPPTITSSSGKALIIGAGGTGNFTYFATNGYVGFGTVSPGFKLDVVGDGRFTGSVISSGWFRSFGATGWLNQDYGGGFYMEDSTWIRSYNGKGLYIGGTTGILAQGKVVSGAGQGFQNQSYQSGRNRIWSFSDADQYGLSYYQGAGSVYGIDGIGIHFGDINLPMFNFRSDGAFSAAVKASAPIVEASQLLMIPDVDPDPSKMIIGKKYLRFKAL